MQHGASSPSQVSSGIEAARLIICIIRAGWPHVYRSALKYSLLAARSAALPTRSFARRTGTYCAAIGREQRHVSSIYTLSLSFSSRRGHITSVQILLIALRISYRRSRWLSQPGLCVIRCRLHRKVGYLNACHLWRVASANHNKIINY